MNAKILTYFEYNLEEIKEFDSDIRRDGTQIFVFMKKIIVYSRHYNDYLTIYDDKLNMISRVFLKSKTPLFSIIPQINSAVF